MQRTRSVFAALGLILLVVPFGVVSTATAYEVYNRSPNLVVVWGQNCPGCFKGEIDSGKHKACPGDKHGCQGETWISWTGSYETVSPHNTKSGKACNSDTEFLKQVLRNMVHSFTWSVFEDDAFTGAIWYCKKPVPAHGWVTIKGKRSERCHVFNAKGKKIFDGPAGVHCGIKR